MSLTDALGKNIGLNLNKLEFLIQNKCIVDQVACFSDFFSSSVDRNKTHQN